ncbi:unnamed protein product [Heterobilharzia americana]|nr:unnamed protein product [Heterobilharzia americana]
MIQASFFPKEALTRLPSETLKLFHFKDAVIYTNTNYLIPCCYSLVSSKHNVWATAFSYSLLVPCKKSFTDFQVNRFYIILSYRLLSVNRILNL